MIRITLVTLIFSAIMNAQSDRFAAFRETYLKELRKAEVVGSGFVFLEDDKKVAEEYYGMANIQNRQPVDSDTIFHWASNTKPFTGIAIMQLRDRGFLKLDDPVTKYLPELRAIHNKFGSMDEITVRYLLTHSAGFRNGTWPWRSNKDWEPFEPKEWSQLVSMFPFTEVLFEPGRKFSYSNPGIIYLGRLIEKLSGEDYEVHIDKNILRPLGMYESYFDTTPPHLLKKRSHSYYVEKGRRSEGRFDADTGITVSNSGLNAPVSDMIKYLNFLTGDPNRRTDHDTVLKRSSLEEMWKPQMPTPFDANGNSGFTTDIGLIFFLDRRGGRTFIGHGGDQNGFISYIDFEPATRKASIIVFNTNVLYPDDTIAEENIYVKLRRSIRALF